MALALLAVITSLSASALAQVDHTVALRQIESAVESTYVFPELRPKIVAQLERSRLARRYDVDDPDVFAQRVTEDLEVVAHDGHLYLTNDPAQYAAMLAPAASSDGLEAFRRAMAVRDHSGLTKLEILPGHGFIRCKWIPPGSTRWRGPMGRLS